MWYQYKLSNVSNVGGVYSQNFESVEFLLSRRTECSLACSIGDQDYKVCEVAQKKCSSSRRWRGNCRSFHKGLFSKNHFTGTKKLAWRSWRVSLSGKRGMLVEMSSSSKRIGASGQFEGSWYTEINCQQGRSWADNNWKSYKEFSPYCAMTWKLFIHKK